MEQEPLLDTNALVHLARQTQVGRKLMAQLALAPETPVFLSAVSVGEVEFLGRLRGWQEQTIKRMADQVRKSLVINLDFPGLPEAYADIQYEVKVNRKPAITNRDNDVWIAATARATSTCLVTSEKWFKNIGGTLIDLAYFDANTGVVTWMRRSE